MQRTTLLNALLFSIATLGLAACGGGGGGSSNSSSSSSGGVEEPGVAEHASLYEELSSNLSTRENELRADWDGSHAPIVYAATLLTASSNNGSKLFNPEYRAANRLFLNGLADLGVQAVVIQINYPILTSTYTANALDYLTAYEEMANEIRALGLKIIVEHNVLLPGYSALDPTSYYSTLSKTVFGREKYEEVLSIVQRINPDYLSLVTEPGTHEHAIQLQMTRSDWSAYVTSVVFQLSIDAPAYTTKLGAGCGTWESQSFITEFSSIDGLDYIDIHAYPLTNNVTNYLELLETWPILIRSINPNLEIVSSEAWLYKAGARELGGSPTNPDFFARDVYSFWSDLDSKFLDVFSISAHKTNYTIIAPFWSQYFFSYLDYSDPALSVMAPEEILDHSYDAAFQAIQNEQTSELGKYYKALIDGSRP